MKYKYIILSNQPFDMPLKTNKWHVANTLANKGFDVLFIDPPLRFKAIKSLIKLGFKKFLLENKKPNLVVFRPVNIFNFWPFSVFNTSVQRWIINKNIINSKQKIILWVYHFDFPGLENIIETINYDVLVYDCVDDYSLFPEYAANSKTNKGVIKAIQRFDDYLKVRFNQNGLKGVEWVNYREQYLASKSDLIIVSAPGLLDKFKEYKSKLHFLPNACDPLMFDILPTKENEPEDIKNIPHPRIGFTGAIDAYKNNIKLIEKCATELKSFNFIIIGPEKLSDPNLNLTLLKSLSNVHFLGVKPYEKTPFYFAHFDVFFIPYHDDPNSATSKGVFPIKYFEALASGLPTVVTNMPSYKDYNIDNLVSKSDFEFVENIKRAVKMHSKKEIVARKKMAYKNSWESKVAKQVDLVNYLLKNE